jgi:hypothetical protein
VQPRPARRLDGVARQLRREHCGGVVIPQLGDRHEFSQHLPRDDAEVADADFDAREGPVSAAIAGIQQPERQAVHPARPLGEDHPRISQRPASFNQPRDVGWIVLAVAIHDDDGVARLFVLEPGQPDGNRALVSEVSAQRQHLDVVDARRDHPECLSHRLARPIVHEEYTHTEVATGEDAIELLEQQ